MKLICYAAILGSVALGSCANNKKEAPKPQPVVECDPALSTYSAHVNPIIQNKCATSGGCHGNGSFTGDFNDFAELKLKVTNGTFKNSVIDRQVPVMPPAGSPELTAEELKTLKCWYNNGALNN